MTFFKSSDNKNSLFSLGVLALIGLVCLFLIFYFQKTVKITAKGSQVEYSKYALSVFDTSGSLIFSISPLNDYYYQLSKEYHVEEKLNDSNTGNVIDQFLIAFKGLFLNSQSITWKTNGVNEHGDASTNYNIQETKNGIKIVRKVNLKTKADELGQVLKYCSGCIISDDKKRAFFNGDTITDSKTLLASKLNLTVFVLGENNYFLNGIKKVFIIASDGTVKAEIDTQGSEVYLQEKWNLLELKTPLNGNSVSQTIVTRF